MKNYDEDIEIQIDKLFKKVGNKDIKENYKEDLTEIFSIIYAINYIKNKAETSRYFKTDYFKITYSCLLESYSLILHNYPKAAALV